MWQSTQQTIRNILVLPLLLVIAIPVFIILGPLWLYGEVTSLLWDLRVKVQMSKRNRTMGQVELIQHLENSDGTLIIESTTLGSGRTRAWWTGDDVLNLAPVTPPVEHENESKASREEKIAEYSFVKWTHENYTDVNTGHAKLVQACGGYKFSQKLLASIPGLRRVHVWSGGLEMRKFELEEPSQVEPAPS